MTRDELILALEASSTRKYGDPYPDWVAECNLAILELFDEGELEARMNDSNTDVIFKMKGPETNVEKS